MTEIEGQGNSDDVENPPAGLVPHNVSEHIVILSHRKQSTVVRCFLFPEKVTECVDAGDSHQVNKPPPRFEEGGFSMYRFSEVHGGVLQGFSSLTSSHKVI